jgi:hypothetical protein
MPLIYPPPPEFGFFERLTDGFMRNGRDIVQFDQLVGQQVQTPAPGTGWRGAAHQGHQMGFAGPIKRARVPGQALCVATRHPAHPDCGLMHTCDRRHTDIQCCADHHSGSRWPIWAFVGFEQDPGMDMRMRRDTAMRDKCLQPRFQRLITALEKLSSA